VGTHGFVRGLQLVGWDKRGGGVYRGCEENGNSGNGLPKQEAGKGPNGNTCHKMPAKLCLIRGL